LATSDFNVLISVYKSRKEGKIIKAFSSSLTGRLRGDGWGKTKGK